jgi:hypothetical protein
MTTSGAQQGIRPGVCLSTSRPASPFIGQIIYMTDVNVSAVWDGTSWVGLDRSRDRNVVINGAMQVAQRGTSTASMGTLGGYFTADRWNTVFAQVLATARFTQSIENDAPTGSGLRKSLKVLTTTASSAAAADRVGPTQIFEGQNLQQFLKGTASAKQFALSFWVKSNLTGTYTIELGDEDNSRQVSASYTVSASGTWEKKTIVFPADTTGAFDNDNAASLNLNFFVTAGTNFTSGTLNTTWNSITNANRNVGQVNLFATLNNYWQITGVQLEAGVVATPFEFEDYSITLHKCQRYYQRTTGLRNFGLMTAQTSTTLFGSIPLQVSMRVPPTSVDANTLRAFDLFNAAAVFFTFGLDGTSSSENMAAITGTSSGLTAFRTYYIIQNGATSFLGFSAEL